MVHNPEQYSEKYWVYRSPYWLYDQYAPPVPLWRHAASVTSFITTNMTDVTSFTNITMTAVDVTSFTTSIMTATYDVTYFITPIVTSVDFTSLQLHCILWLLLMLPVLLYTTTILLLLMKILGGQMKGKPLPSCTMVRTMAVVLNALIACFYSFDLVSTTLARLLVKGHDLKIDKNVSCFFFAFNCLIFFIFNQI